MPYKDPEEMRRWRRRNRVKQNGWTRDWERRNPDKVRASQMRGRARRKARQVLLSAVETTEAQRGAQASCAKPPKRVLRSRLVMRAFDPDEQRILGIIRAENGRVSGRAMRCHADMPVARLRCAMQRLRNNGVIEAVGPSTKAAVWTLIPEGRLQ